MSRLECGRCRSVFQDVVRVKKCPLCGSIDFRDADTDFSMEIRSFPTWFTSQHNIGYAYFQTNRIDSAAHV